MREKFHLCGLYNNNMQSSWKEKLRNTRPWGKPAKQTLGQQGTKKGAGIRYGGGGREDERIQSRRNKIYDECKQDINSDKMLTIQPASSTLLVKKGYGRAKNENINKSQLYFNKKISSNFLSQTNNITSSSVFVQINKKMQRVDPLPREWQVN